MYFKVGFNLNYKNDVVNQLVRKKQFDEFDFLSFVGGILGLFAGFSALSLVELIYWFTIRIVFSKFNIKVLPSSSRNFAKLYKVKDYVETYLNESSIHGFNRILEFSWISW